MATTSDEIKRTNKENRKNLDDLLQICSLLKSKTIELRDGSINDLTVLLRNLVPPPILEDKRQR